LRSLTKYGLVVWLIVASEAQLIAKRVGQEGDLVLVQVQVAHVAKIDKVVVGIRTQKRFLAQVVGKHVAQLLQSSTPPRSITTKTTTVQ
jgi:hypothetical protein